MPLEGHIHGADAAGGRGDDALRPLLYARHLPCRPELTYSAGMAAGGQLPPSKGLPLLY